MSNLTKDVCLYDINNRPLTISGIEIYLCDANSGKIHDRQLSHDLNPGSAGAPSDTWGVQLTFPAGNTPVDIFTADPTYIYPGNTVRYLNGELYDRIDLDLLALPPSPGGQSNPPASPMPSDLAKWVATAP